MLKSCQRLVDFLVQLLLVIFISWFHYINLAGCFGSSFGMFLLMEKATVNRNKTWLVKQLAPLMGLVFKMPFWSTCLTVI